MVKELSPVKQQSTTHVCKKGLDSRLQLDISDILSVFLNDTQYILSSECLQDNINSLLNIKLSNICSTALLLFLSNILRTTGLADDAFHSNTVPSFVQYMYLYNCYRRTPPPPLPQTFLCLKESDILFLQFACTYCMTWVLGSRFFPTHAPTPKTHRWGGGTKSHTYPSPRVEATTAKSCDLCDLSM